MIEVESQGEDEQFVGGHPADPYLYPRPASSPSVRPLIKEGRGEFGKILS